MQRVPVTNSLRLVKHASLPRQIELLVCAFLALPDLVEFALLSQDMSALLRLHLPRVRDVVIPGKQRSR